MTTAFLIWTPILLFWSLTNVIIRGAQRRWGYALFWTALSAMNFASFIFAVDTAKIQRETNAALIACKDAPAEVPYSPGMSVCPGQSVIVTVPVIVDDDGEDI